ncbi:MAG: Arc family DNA-binding protein [Pseudomonadales bacterium]|nr:Arc family DNA-binding protein [Pseudomonadales bacterium]MCP5331514.1 Arc family DNA-binding protein [Pseudomonadales bacterium]MCP5343397.1 Arc family DNA-binding protein [Pseudomonadales bacterium]
MTEQAQVLENGTGNSDHDTESKRSKKPAMSKFVVRMPAELLETLKRVSRHHNRSMNSEINLLLGRYIEQIKGDSRPGADEHLTLDSQLQRKLSALSPQKIEALLDLLE